MACIRHQLVATKIAGEDFFASRDRLIDVHTIEAGAPPCLFRAFDNESRRVGIELVGMHPNPSVLSLLEDEGECVIEFLMCSEPDVFAGSNINVGFERVGVCCTDAGIDPVRANNDVEVLVAVDWCGFRLEFNLYAKRTGTILQDIEKSLPADPTEAVAAGPHHCPTIVNSDVIPIDKRIANCLGGNGVVGVKIAERLVRQNHTPAKGVVRFVALDDDNIVRSVTELQRNREVEPTRASPKNCRTHAPAPFAVTDAACRRTKDITNVKYLDLKLFAASAHGLALPATSMTYGIW